MAETGLTWVRVGEFAWSRLEAEPGKLTFEWLDRAVETLGRAGLKVVMGTPTATPPRWMLDKHPDMLAVDAQGNTRKFGSRRHYDFSHEGYRAEAARIATMPGPAGHAWSRLRFEGFRDEIAKACPAARLFGNLYRLEASVAHGQVQAAELAIKYPQADFLYVASGALALGAARVRQRLRQRAEIVAAGLTREGAAALGAGDIAMAVSVPAVLIGRLAVQYAIRAAEDKGLPGAVPGPYPYPTVFAPMVSITRDLLGDYDIESYDLAPAGWRPDSG